MSDLADEIPQRAFINAQIIMKSARNGGLDQATNVICQRYGIPTYDVNNPALHVSLLYCLIVFPKEFFDTVDLTNATCYLNKKEKEIIELFEIICWSKRPCKNVIYNSNRNGLITKIRNAISHAHISIDKDLIYCLWDQNQKNPSIIFKCKISQANLGKFLEIVGGALANIRANRNRSGDGRLT